MEGERANGGEDLGVDSGNIVGGNPVQVTLIKAASRLSRGREDECGASWPMSVTQWRRPVLTSSLEGQERIGCAKVSGTKPQPGKELSASGNLLVGWAPT